MAKLSDWDENSEQAGPVLNRTGELIRKINEKITRKYPDLPDNRLLETLLRDYENFSFTLAVTGMQSAGKSTLLNSMLQYPLLPVCETAATRTPVRIVYASELFLTLRYKEPENGEAQVREAALAITEEFDPAVFRKLKEYACVCMALNVLSFESLQYFTDIDITKEPAQADCLIMTPSDPRHTLVLLLILLNTCTGQTDRNAGAAMKEIAVRRDALLRELELPSIKEYSITVGWDCGLLCSGLVLTDLPGLYTATKWEPEEDGKTGRTEDSCMEQMLAADAVLVVFDQAAVAGRIPGALQLIVNDEKMSYVVKKANRIIPVLNKADLAKNINTSINSIRSMLEGLDIPFIYPAASIYGEYGFLKHGIPFKRTLFYKANAESYRRRLIQKISGADSADIERMIERKLSESLSQIYHAEISFRGENRRERRISLNSFIGFFAGDYIGRIQCLKELQIIQAAAGYMNRLLDTLDSRIQLLAVMQENGKKRCRQLSAGLSEKCGGLAYSLNEKLSEELSEAQEAFPDIRKASGLVKESFLLAFKRIDQEASGMIRQAAEGFQSDWCGHTVMDSRGDEKARENKRIFDELMDSLGSFSALAYMEEAGGKMTEMIALSCDIYKKKLSSLSEAYAQFPAKAGKELEELFTGLSDRQDGEDGMLRLNGLLSAQLDSFSRETAALLNRDNRFFDIQTDSIHAVTQFLAGLEEAFRNAATQYMKRAAGPTFWKKRDRLDVTGLLRSLDKPFFEESAVEKLKDRVDGIFDGYRDRMQEGMNGIRTEYERINRTGLENIAEKLQSFVTEAAGAQACSAAQQLEMLESVRRDIAAEAGLLLQMPVPMSEQAGYEWAAEDAASAAERLKELEGKLGWGSYRRLVFNKLEEKPHGS